MAQILSIADETQVEDILDEIDEFEGDAGSKVIVIVARIIDQVPNKTTVHDFNDAVEGMVTGRTDYGTELFMVDMEDGAGLNYSIWPGDLYRGHDRLFTSLCNWIYQNGEYLVYQV